MKILRLYSGNDGQSHFEDIDIELIPVDDLAKFSAPFNTNNIKFGAIEGLDEMAWHRMDSPQYIILLRGAMELEVGDGTKRIVNAGDILLAEDTTGQGHILRSINKQKWEFLIAPAE